LDLANREAKYRGWPATCTYLKDLYAQASAICLGLAPTPIPFRKSNKRGIDKNLAKFLPLLRSDDPNSKRGALSILRLGYLIHSEPDFDVTSVTALPEGKGVETIVESFTLLAKRWVPPIDPVGYIDIVPRACAGPNGQSSLMDSHLDALALSRNPELLQALADLAAMVDPVSKGEPESPQGDRFVPEDNPELDSIWQMVRDAELCASTGKVWGDTTTEQTSGSDHEPDPTIWERGLKPWVLRLSAWTKANFSVEGRHLPVSRLAFLAEGGCKTRVIAIGDLFSQAVLRPIHKKLMGRLRSIPQDCTFDQTNAISFLKEVTQSGSVYSFDLTSATDRFPVVLQEIVMAQAFGKEFASLWRKVICDLRPFTVKGRKRGSYKEIYYARGQGMGLYSSWPAFAYTHHVFIQWCALQVGRYPFQEYRIIGDDVTIANKEVADRYKEMLDLIEVPISIKKSIVSERPPFAGEIAKRLILGGVDVSPIPPDLIVQTKKYFYMLPALVDEVTRRYGLDYTTLSCLATLKDNFVRKNLQEKAFILLTAPLVFALVGGHPLYGSGDLGGNSDLEKSTLNALVRQTPWSRVDPEVLSDLGLALQAIRNVSLERQYEEVYETWDFFHPGSDQKIPEVQDFRALGDKPRSVTVESQHPFWSAYGWINGRLLSLFEARCSIFSAVSDEEQTLLDVGLRHCMDPTLRSYQCQRQKRSKEASRLTLDAFKVLTGEMALPEHVHKKGGLREAWIRFQAH